MTASDKQRQVILDSMRELPNRKEAAKRAGVSPETVKKVIRDSEEEFGQSNIATMQTNPFTGFLQKITGGHAKKYISESYGFSSSHATQILVSQGSNRSIAWFR